MTTGNGSTEMTPADEGALARTLRSRMAGQAVEGPAVIASGVLRRGGAIALKAPDSARSSARLQAFSRFRTRQPAPVALRTIGPDSTLYPDQQWFSDSGNTMLAYQSDGNLVVYVRRAGVMPSNDPNVGWVARWASNTAGQPAGSCVMQGDGNLVVYRPDGAPIWASNTWGNPGASLAIQDDENVVIYTGAGPIWSTNTWVGGVVRSGFSAIDHGFKFINSFPDGYWGFGFLQFSTTGLCGGMSFAALDYYAAGMQVPATSSTPSAVNDPLGQQINARQTESVLSNLGPWAVQILNPDDHALNYWSTHDEWGKLKSAIDAGVPAPIGVGVYLNGGASHQVVALGYREGARERWIHTYDPNLPGAEGYVHLAPNQLHWSDQLGGEWRGFFVESYFPKTPT